MEGLALLVGHLLGDYVLQRDWEARLKTVSRPAGPRPEIPDNTAWMSVQEIGELAKKQLEWGKQLSDSGKAPWACTLHCLKYTLGVYLACFWFLPWWTYPVVFLAHWPVDRYRLARKFMKWNGQEEFATGLFFPWSIIVVDNVFHLLVLFYLGLWWYLYLR